MEVLLAENAGFCFGVKEAMTKTFSAVNKNKNRKIYTYGPLIHNNQVINKLETMGVWSVDELKDAKDNVMIVRSHGVPLEVYDLAQDYNIEIMDATCPFVRKVQKLAKEYYEKGYSIIILGNSKHPEVIGINGWCNNSAYIIEDIADLKKISNYDKICLLAQTTVTLELWDLIVVEIAKKAREFKKFNTICTATKERQSSCAEVAKRVDAMIVIGGYHSSNTQKLVQISKKYCENTYHIETAEELPINHIKHLNKIGVTAGASTPDWIIKEAIEKMDNMEQQDNTMLNMMEEIENSFKVPRRGSTVTGKVIQVTDNEIMVNIGYKSDGVIPKTEISNDPSVNPHDIAKEGDEIEVYVLKIDDGEGNILLSKKRIDAEKNWEDIEKSLEDKSIVQVKVLETVKGGVIAGYKEIKGFIPASQLSTNYVEDLQKFIGEQLSVQVIDLNKGKKKVVFSRRIVLERENEIKRKALWESIQKDTVIEGEVKRITNFGAFVDIGGIDGLIHISDLSWGRVKHPSEVVSVGDKVKVMVLDFDKENKKVSLGLKQMIQEPWENIDKKYAIGNIVEGKIVRLVDFGAFVELEAGVDGLVHISQISDRHIAKPSEEVHVGQKVKVKILDVNTESKRISLSMKEAVENLAIEDTQNNNDDPITIGEILKSKE
ncbi:bifunctional 4-hydroxy-3-methylbut-2-enyl diphosphate reductase/30S ribosomal protein S1 [Clostridiaceae bacterium 35-E11]